MHRDLIDIEFALQEVEIEAEKLTKVLANTDLSVADDDLEAWLRIQGLASVVEKIYTGYENVMQKIAATVDRNRVQKTQDWHVALIRRMTNPYEGIRPAFLDPETAEILQKLRAFRHRERNTYGSNLNVEKTIENAALVDDLRDLFRQDLDLLSAHLENTDENDGGDGSGGGASGGPPM